MIQKIYIPRNNHLRQVVNFLTYVEFTKEDPFEGWTAIFPNATSNLILSLDDRIQVNHTAVDCSVYASCSSTVAFHPYPGMKFMTVQFNSYGLHAVKNIPAHELQDSLISLELLFKASELDILKQQLLEADRLEEKFIVLESFIAKKVAVPEVDPRLPFAIASLKYQQPLRIDALSESICLSNRGLQKLFKKYVGMSPVFYKKITRFNQAANLLLRQQDTPLTQIAYMCGYYDQAHFIKDFRQFGGISPSEFLQLQAKGSDFYNYNLKDLSSLET